jgi:hypothetical protein
MHFLIAMPTSVSARSAIAMNLRLRKMRMDRRWSLAVGRRQNPDDYK